MNPKKLIIENLKRILFEISEQEVVPEVALVEDSRFGDFTSNVAMQALKLIKTGTEGVFVRQIPVNVGGTNPRAIADYIKTEYEKLGDPNIDKIEVAGPGFINFYLRREYLSKTLTDITQNILGSDGLRHENPQKVIVEFGDPNPFKEIHIGHLRNFCIGESFSKLLESQGHQVVRANYQGDVGLHVAKALYGIMKQESGIMDKNLSLGEKSQMLAKAYSYGATEFESNDEAKKEIIEINKRVYELTGHPELESVSHEILDQARHDNNSQDEGLNYQDDSLKQLWEEGRKVSLEHFEKLYKRIGVSYDKYYFESVTAKKGREIVLSHVDDGVFERSDGAIVYRGEQDGLHTRVFLTQQDYATYEGKDLALAILKSEDQEYDRSVILTGNEQAEYFQVMLAALKKIQPDLAKVTDHYTFGHVRLKEGKMSSRTGDVITASWLLDEAVKRVREAFSDMDEMTSEKVGVGAVKYSMLKFSIPSDIHFSFEESISLEGNSGPYLQYTYTRTLSVLRKYETLNSKFETNSNFQISHLEKEESELLRFLVQYPYHVAQATDDFAPNLLTNYLFELSQKFNLFYQKCNILNPVISNGANLSQEEVRNFRLQLTQATGNVLKKGLTILGIETVERM